MTPKSSQQVKTIFKKMEIISCEFVRDKNGEEHFYIHIEHQGEERKAEVSERTFNMIVHMLGL